MIKFASDWFSRGSPVSSTNKTDRHNITKTVLKVALSTINQTKPPIKMIFYFAFVTVIIAGQNIPTLNITYREELYHVF